MLTDHQWGPSDNHIRAISQQMPRPSSPKIHLKITYPNFDSNFPGANVLTWESHTWKDGLYIDMGQGWYVPLENCYSFAQCYRILLTAHNNKDRKLVPPWSHKRYSISSTYMQAVRYLLWVFFKKIDYMIRRLTVLCRVCALRWFLGCALSQTCCVPYLVHCLAWRVATSCNHL